MCTVLLRLQPEAEWPVLVGAVRDEFADRAWDPPDAHWNGAWSALLGGRDRTAGGTWLAVDPTGRSLAALLNGVRREPPGDGSVRPTRGTLALDALGSGVVPTADSVVDHDGFHLVVATLDATQVWSWDGTALQHQQVSPGDHIVVNLGVDTPDDPLIPHFAPLLAATPDPLLIEPEPWEPWTDLLAGDGLEPDDPRALIVRRDIEDRTYASTSATLVALGEQGIRYAFNPVPTDPQAWYEITPS